MSVRTGTTRILQQSLHLKADWFVPYHRFVKVKSGKITDAITE